MQGWATACKVGLEKVVYPNFDMGILFSARDIDKFSIPVLEENWTKLITKRFVFNGDAISKLKAKVMASSGQAAFRHLSRVEVVTAIIWKVRMRVAQVKHGHSRPSLLTLAYNFRGKTSLHIPENAFGNVFKSVLAKYKPTETKFEFPDLFLILYLSNYIQLIIVFLSCSVLLFAFVALLLSCYGHTIVACCWLCCCLPFALPSM
ncbi:hypothetical protein Dsin_023658 [Dipteronia sinensis]|uniref:Uncharacterized protein n=1 Tax=Dipteronia sinensis TaxID=43782 RepID=A0AAE0E0Z6_9ROSI|nr:hypothetical protein Dsin_023658 [Dipteronia sinensis]